jgi:hypothetical protein
MEIVEITRIKFVRKTMAYSPILHICSMGKERGKERGKGGKGGPSIYKKKSKREDI